MSIDTMQNEREYLSSEQLAHKLNVSLKFIRKHVRRVPGYRKIGRLVRFNRLEVEKALLRESFLLPLPLKR